MSKVSTKSFSRKELLALSREELVDIILTDRVTPDRVTSRRGTADRVTPFQEKSLVFDDKPPASSESVSGGELSLSGYNLFCRQVAENFPNGAVAVLDRQLTYVYVTGQELRRFGMTGEDFVGQPIGMVASEEETQHIRENLQRVFRGESCTIETIVGDETYLIIAIPLVSDDGSIHQLLAVSQNITERQTALRQAREREDQFRALAENIPGAVYISTNDTAREIVYISGKIENLCGYSAEDFLEGRTSSRALMHPDDQKLVKPALKEAITNQQPYHLTYRWKHKEGHDCWIEEYGANIVKDQKQYFQGVLFDVTEKKNRERELQQQNEDLKKANAELDHFAYSVSHDLRAPLTSAMGLLHLLKSEKERAQRDHFIEIIQQSLMRLDNFVQEIIHLTKNARTELKVDAIHLEDMIAEVVASQKYNADYDRVAISTEITQPKDFHTDTRRLWIVLNNLISNAIRYHFPLRGNSYVRITATVEQQQLTLTVEDNGIGIQQEHLDKIFDMFYRATDRKSGSGLGLYLVKETVERLNGNVAVTSAYEEGTTFTVRLPSLQHLISRSKAEHQ